MSGGKSGSAGAAVRGAGPERGPGAGPASQAGEERILEAERSVTVTAPRAAQLLGVSVERFRRLAAAGWATPAGRHVNRYQAVVYTYLMSEVRRLVLERPEALRGRLPCAPAGGGADVRALALRRNEVLALLAGRSLWERAAVWWAQLPAEGAGPPVDGVEHRYLAGAGRPWFRGAVVLPEAPAGFGAALAAARRSGPPPLGAMAGGVC